MTKRERDIQRQRILKRVYETKGWESCVGCGHSFTVRFENKRYKSELTIDHIINVSRRPDLGNDDDKTQLMCLGCNVLKKQKKLKPNGIWKGE